MIKIKVLQDIITDHNLCPVQKEELEKVIEQEKRYMEFMKMYTEFPLPLDRNSNINKIHKPEPYKEESH